MRTLGIIGGMGPLATQHFYGQIINYTWALRDRDHLHIVVDSNPGIPDRSAYVNGDGASPVAALRRSAVRLIEFGCDLLVMPCNTAHVFFDDIVQSVDPIDFIHWIDCAVDYLGRMGIAAVGLMATNGTISTRLYQERLERTGIAYVVPSQSQQHELMRSIYAVKAGSVSRDLANGVLSIAESLVRRGADCVLLGCTELSVLLRLSAASDREELVDPSDVVARRLVEIAGARLRISGVDAGGSVHER